MESWLAAIDAHPETIDTDRIVARFLAQQPDRLWSLSDVLHGLHHEYKDLRDLRDSVNELVSGGYLDDLVEVVCDEHRDGFWGDECTDPLCGDTLFLISR